MNSNRWWFRLFQLLELKIIHQPSNTLLIIYVFFPDMLWNIVLCIRLKQLL